MCRDIRVHYSACGMTIPLIPPIECDKFLDLQARCLVIGRDLLHRKCPDYLLWILNDLHPGHVCPNCMIYHRKVTGRKWPSDEGLGYAKKSSVMSMAFQWWENYSEGRSIRLPGHMQAMQYTQGSWWQLRPIEQSQIRPAASIANPHRPHRPRSL